jgi:hypothetical protein
MKNILQICRFAQQGAVLAACLLLIMPSTVLALEQNWLLGARALASDNFNRQTLGVEESGSLLGYSVGLELKDQQGRSTFSLQGRAGEEVLKTPETERNDVYILSGEYRITSAEQKYALLSAALERSTRVGGTLDRERQLIDSMDITLGVGNRVSRGRNWDLGISQTWIENRDENIIENSGSLGVNWDIVSNVNLEAEASALIAEERISSDNWDEGELELVLRRRLRTGSDYGALINIMRSNVDYGQVDEYITVSKSSFQLFYNLVHMERTRMETGAGLERTIVENTDELLNPTVHFLFRRMLSRTADLSLRSDLGVRRISTEVETVTWDKRTETGMELEWRADNNITVLPYAALTRDVLLDDGVTQGRTDDGTVVGLSTEWFPVPDIEVSFRAQSEEIDSSVDEERLRENSMELTILAVF